MFGVSGTELFIIVVFALFIFGPERLPAVGRTLGQIIREFKRAQSDMESLIKAEMLAVERKERSQTGTAAPDDTQEGERSDDTAISEERADSGPGGQDGSGEAREAESTVAARPSDGKEEEAR